VVRSVNDKNAQLQRQLDSAIRDANSEIELLGSKLLELERDLELEKRKVKDIQEASRVKDKEYEKLKSQHDKMKRKILLGAGGPLVDAGLMGNAPGRPNGGSTNRSTGSIDINPLPTVPTTSSMRSLCLTKTSLPDRFRGLPLQCAPWANLWVPNPLIVLRVSVKAHHLFASSSPRMAHWLPIAQTASRRWRPYLGLQRAEDAPLREHGH